MALVSFVFRNIILCLDILLFTTGAIRPSSPVIVISLLILVVAFALSVVGNAKNNNKTIIGAVLYVIAGGYVNSRIIHHLIDTELQICLIKFWLVHLSSDNLKSTTSCRNFNEFYLFRYQIILTFLLEWWPCGKFNL